MKKIIVNIMLAVATIAVVACQKEISDLGRIENSDFKELHFRVRTNSNPVTRTYITNDGAGNYTPAWKNGDILGAYLGTGSLQNVALNMTLTNQADDGDPGDFNGTSVAAGSGTFQAFYPSAAWEKGYDDSGDYKRLVGLNIGDKNDNYKQHPSLTSPDPLCDVLISKTCDYVSDGTTVVIDDLYFGRPLSILKINLVGSYADGEEVSWLKFTTSSGSLSGRASISLNTGIINTWTVSKNYAWAEYTTSKPVINHDTNKSVFLVVNPTTLAIGTTITVTASTENYDIEKSFAISSGRYLCP